jgi:anaerobic selenocysteine-containing dehydrogenase
MIDRETAIEIARKHAAERGWGFGEPVEVISRRGWFGGAVRYEIKTNAGKRGTNGRFVIDAVTGEIISEGYIPR